MKKILLINQKKIPHYRVPIYNYLSEYLKKYKFRLTVVAEGIQNDNLHPINFCNERINLNFEGMVRLLTRMKPDAVIFWVDPHPRIFFIMVLAKIRGIKVIHWGHRRDQQRPHAFYKNFVYGFEHWIDDAIILYAGHLRRYLGVRSQPKTFVANNTLNLTIYKPVRRPREDVLRKYGIRTHANIICMGRMHRRKRIEDLIRAFQRINLDDVGLILAGPDSEGILKKVDGKNIYKVGPVYGEESLDLLSASDVYCLPGAVGLSIVDAFYCGLPVVTERVRHGPEIMYLKDGINGFAIPKGDINQLAAKLKLLLTDCNLREKFSHAAKDEVATSGHIDRMCEGFRDALQYVFKMGDRTSLSDS